MKLVIITHPNPFDNEVSIITSLFENGLELLHIRKPNWDAKEVEQFVQKIPEQFRQRIALHSHYHLANELGVGGIHITNATKGKGIENRFIHSKLSISTHSIDEALMLKPIYRYAFISPVFRSISKDDYKAAFADNQLVEANKKSNVPLFALGGVDVNTIPNAKEIDFAGVAVLGALWNREPQGIVSHFIKLKKIAYDHL